MRALDEQDADTQVDGRYWAISQPPRSSHSSYAGQHFDCLLDWDWECEEEMIEAGDLNDDGDGEDDLLDSN